MSTVTRTHIQNAASLHLTKDFSSFVKSLHELKAEAGETWPELAKQFHGDEGIARFRSCPLLNRGWEKPRGYAGDAVMLDYMYGVEHPQFMPELDLTEEERSLFELSTNADCTTASRNRLHIAVDALDKCAHTFEKPRALSVACGHARETLLSDAVSEGLFDEVILLDQDPHSLGYIRQNSYHPSVKTIEASISLLLKTQELPGPFQLVYSLGLYDYLPQSLAERLTCSLFSRLAPGGRLLVGNYNTSLIDGAFMEAVMDWWLIYRTDEEMRQLAQGIPENEIRELQVFKEQRGVISFLDIARA